MEKGFEYKTLEEERRIRDGEKITTRLE